MVEVHPASTVPWSPTAAALQYAPQAAAAGPRMVSQNSEHWQQAHLQLQQLYHLQRLAGDPRQLGVLPQGAAVLQPALVAQGHRLLGASPPGLPPGAALPPLSAASMHPALVRHPSWLCCTSQRTP